MDTRSSSLVAQTQVPLLSPTDDQSTGLNNQRKHSKPPFDTKVSYGTETKQGINDHTDDRLPDDDSELSQDLLNYHPPLLTKPILDLEPPKMMARPPSSGKDLNSGFSYQKPTRPAMNFSRSPPHKSDAYRKPAGDLPKRGT